MAYYLHISPVDYDKLTSTEVRAYMTMLKQMSDDKRLQQDKLT